MKVKQGAENMLTMLLARDKSKKLIADAEQMLADSKIKIDGIKMAILREEQNENNKSKNNHINKNIENEGNDLDVPDRPNIHEKTLEQRVDDIRHHIDIETRVAEGARNMLKHFLIAQDKKGTQEVGAFKFYETRGRRIRLKIFEHISPHQNRYSSIYRHIKIKKP